MHRITITLPEELGATVQREARRRGTSVSAVVRRAVAADLGMAEERSRPLRFAAVGKSGRRHVARDADAILAREWGRADRRR